MTKIRSIFIKYKFLFIENTTHSSYLYQKVFRSIYGYTQNVTKKNNKIYNYFRNGVVSCLPYIKSGKNSLILPVGCETELIDYFETGTNPTHNWKSKGNWTAEYKKDFIEIDKESVIKAIELHINNYLIINNENKSIKLLDEISLILSKENLSINYINYLIAIMKKIIDTNWFIESYKDSNDLQKFYDTYNKLKVKYNV